MSGGRSFLEALDPEVIYALPRGTKVTVLERQARASNAEKAAAARALNAYVERQRGKAK